MDWRLLVEEGVRHHEVRPFALTDPERQIVGIGVAVVQKPSFLHEQAPRIEARAVAAVPPEGTGADAVANRLDGGSNVAALDVFVELVVFRL